MDHDREAGPGWVVGHRACSGAGRPGADTASAGTRPTRPDRRVAVHLERRMRVDGRLRDPGRLNVARGVWRSGRRLPEGGAREVGVLADRRVEDDVGHHPVRPLCAEERLELLLSARLVVPRAAERDERRIPAPLVGIEGAGRQAGGPDPGRVEHGSSRATRSSSVGGSEVPVSAFTTGSEDLSIAPMIRVRCSNRSPVIRLARGLPVPFEKPPEDLTHGEVCLCDRRRDLLSWQRHHRRQRRSHPQGARPAGLHPQARSVHQRGSGHDEPVPARRGLRHRRRRRDRPRPRPLRALHRREPVASSATSRPAASTRRSSPRSAAATTSAARSRSSRTSPTRSRSASRASPATATRTS